VAVTSVIEYLRGRTALELVRFVLRDDTWEAFERAAREAAG